MRERAESLTRQLLAWPSVTGSDGERAFAGRLQALLAAWPYFSAHPEHLWLEDAGDGRSTVCALVRGTGDAAAVLAGHYDVVGVEDFGDLAPLAGDPDALRPRLIERVDARAAQDVASPDWMPGRGALDMKSGLAAALAVLEQWTSHPRGSVLFVACPDEEAHSAGARAANRVFARVAAEHGLRFALGISQDVVTDATAGEYGRQVFCGAVGKVLLCAKVRGAPAHAGEPLAGLSAHALAAEVVRAIEGDAGWAGAGFDDPSLPPPILLRGGDTKTAYDVTMPQDVLLLFNLILREASPAAALDRFAERVMEALEVGRARWPGDKPPLTVTRGDVPESDGDPVALADAALVPAGPGAVVALGSVRYAPVPFADEALRAQLTGAAGDIRVGGPYPHVSDISFLDDGTFPWINAGPWGRDFHQLAERVHTGYAFGELPDLLERLLESVLG